MLRNLGIRWQILSALTLPVLILALVAGQATYASYREMRQANEALDLSSAAASFTRLVTGLSGERLLTVAAMAGSPEAKAQLKTVRGQIDVGVQQLRALIYRTDDQPYNDEERQILEDVSAGHDTIPAIRKLADSGKATPEQVAKRYDELIARDLRVPGDIGAILDDNTVQRNFARFSDLGYAIEGLSHEQLVGLGITFSRRPTVAQQQALGAAHAEAAGWLAEFDRTALPDQRQFLTTAMAKVAAQDKAYDAMLARFAAAGTRRASGVDGQLWTATTQARIQALSSVLDAVAQDGTRIAQDAYDDARRSAQLTAGGALAAVLLMLVVALTLSRRISRPLRRLTAAAGQVRDELPQIVAQVQADDTVDISLPTVESGGRNEVERLAAAFTDVNAVTLRIAREQAILRAAVAGMFVNVARRNQTLLSRQLSFIDHLERTEENPDSLENLFRLDHLAARMRRNAESLLVLAGVESGRRLRNAMPLSDVVRTAISEIEHYDRVSLVFQADPPVYPHLALPTAHLLAELLENATNFSDPGSEVVVSTAGHAGGVRLTITDAGLGMTDEELEEANARIAEPPASEGIGSQRLGFFVVGRLAQRLDAGVTLRAGRARGTVVVVDLPVSLFESGSLAGLAPATTSPEELPAPAPAPALTGPPAALTGAPAGPAQTPLPVAPPVAPAARGGLPRRGAEPVAPPAGTAAPSVPLPALPLPEAPAAGAATEGWSPTVPDAWAPLPTTGEPAYRPETPAAPSAPPAEPAASAAAPYAPPAPDVTPVPPAEPAPSGGSEAPEGARPGLFSGFRSRRESPADEAPPVPALPPADVPEAPEVPSPWSPAAYEPSTPAAAPAGPAPTAPPAAPPAEAVVAPPAEPYHPPLPAGLAGAVWSPPAPAARTQEPAETEAAPAPWSPVAAEPGAEPVAEPAAEPWLEPTDAAETDTTAPAAPRLTGTGPMDVLPARRGRPALLRARKPAPATSARPAAEETAAAAKLPPPVPAQQEPRVAATPLSAEAAAEWAALADSPAGATPIVTAPPTPAAPEPRGSSPAAVGAPRSSIASEALTELSRLSSYSPASVQDEGRPTLRRRTPAPPAEPEPLPELGETGQRARTAANVRSMLAGFKAGVERGRTSPSAHRPAPRVSDTSVPAQRHVGEDGGA